MKYIPKVLLSDIFKVHHAFIYKTEKVNMTVGTQRYGVEEGAGTVQRAEGKHDLNYVD